MIMPHPAAHRSAFLPLYLLSLSLLLGLTSCSGLQFRRDFKAATKAPPQEGVVGAWSGTWSSRVNGHQGTLQCLVTPPASPEATHTFRYRATWMKILSGTFSSDHQVKPAGAGKWTFSGQHQMPKWAGGLYSYLGTIQNDSFHATYDCAMDRGDYRMTRVSTASP
jgi:hypothetical protein